MTRSRRFLTQLSACTLLAIAAGLTVVAPSAADAQQPAPLVRVTFEGQIPDTLKKGVDSAYTNGIKADSRALSPMDAVSTEKALRASSPALVACYTPDCLKRVGEVLETTVAIGILCAGEAQIYDFEVVVYDLTTGTPSATKKGTCEICTTSEAQLAFTNVFSGALKEAEIKPWVGKPPETPPVADAPKVEDAPITVEVTVEPATAVIDVGGRTVGTGTATFTVKPGDYQLSASAEGYKPLEMPLHIGDETKGPVHMELELTAAPKTTVTVTTRSPGLLDDVNQPAFGWISVGLGTASIIGGGILLSMDGDTTCSEGPKTACPKVFDTTGGGVALVSVGSALVAGGAFLVLWEVLAGAPVEKPRAAEGASLPFQIGFSPAGDAFVGFGSPF